MGPLRAPAAFRLPIRLKVWFATFHMKYLHSGIVARSGASKYNANIVHSFDEVVQMGEISSRAAALPDLESLWALLRDSADQVPFKLDSDADQEEVLSELMICCTFGLSPLVLDADKKVIGAFLMRRDPFEWGFRNSPALHVTYVAFAAGAPTAELLAPLVEDLKARKVPLYFSVKSGNGLGLPAVLQAAGFAHLANSAWGDLYLWEPQKPH